MARAVARMYLVSTPEEDHPTNEELCAPLGLSVRLYQVEKAKVRQELGLSAPPGGRPKSQVAPPADVGGASIASASKPTPAHADSDSHDPMFLELADDSRHGWSEYPLAFVLAKARAADMTPDEAGAIPIRIQNGVLRKMIGAVLAR